MKKHVKLAKMICCLVVIMLLAVIAPISVYADISDSVLLDTTPPTAGDISLIEINDDGTVVFCLEDITDGNIGSGTYKTHWKITKGETVFLDEDHIYAQPITVDYGSISITEKGTYKVTVDLTDGVGNTTAANYLTKDIYLSKQGSGSVSIRNWNKGETPYSPVAYSDRNTVAGIVYKYKGLTDPDTEYSSTVPTEPGLYMLQATFQEIGIYEEYVATTTFEITNNEPISTTIILDSQAPTLTNVYFDELIGDIVTINAIGISDGANSSGVKTINWTLRNSENTIVYSSTTELSSAVTTDAVEATITNVGTYTVEVELIDAFGNSTADTAHGNYTATTTFSRGFTVQLSQNAYTYNGNNNEPGVTVTDNETVLVENTDYTVEYVNNKNVGTASVIVTGINRYDATKTVNFTINKKELKVYADDIAKTYGIANPTLTYTYTGNVDGEIPGFTGSLATTATTTSTQGDYPITQGTLDIADNNLFLKNNYYISFTGGTLSIQEGIITATANNYSGIYDGNAHGITVSVSYPTSGYTLRYRDDGGNYTLTDSPVRTNAGTTEVFFKVTAFGFGDMLGTGVIEISPKSLTSSDITASLSETQYTYDGNEHRPVVTVKDGTKTLVEGTDYTINYVNHKNAGTASAVVTGKDNYANSITLEFTINPVTLKVTPDELSKTYGENDPTLTVAYTGAIAGETPASHGNLSRVAGENVGTYEISQGTFEVINNNDFKASNYNVEFVTGKHFTINPKLINASTITVSVSPDSFEYDGTSKKPEPVVKDGNTTLVKDTDYQLVYSDNKNVGIATISIVGKNNYTGTKNVNFEITKRAITVTPDNVTKSAGQPDPTLTYTVQRVVDGETAKFTGALTREVGEAFGSYEISKGELELANNGAFLANNYSFTVATGRKLTIVGNSITRIDLNQTTFTYDGTNHIPVARVYSNSYELTKDVDYTLQYTNNKNAGTATVTATGIGNYSGSFSKTFTINKRTLNIKGDNQTIYQGDAIPTLTYTVTNLVEGEAPKYSGALSTSATSVSPIGTYDILRNTLTPINNSLFIASNYEVNYTKGTLTIQNRDMNVVYGDYNGKYDGRPHGISLTVVEPAAGYTIKYSETGSNYSTNVITLTNTGNKTVYFEITANGYNTFYGHATINIANEGLYNARVVLEQNQYTYNGLQHKPKTNIFINSRQLVENTDYTLSYTDNINVGTATVIITGKGEYSGTRSEQFWIVPAPLVIRPSSNYSKTYQENDPASFAVSVTGCVNNEQWASTGNLERLPGEDVGQYEIISQGTFRLIPNGKFNPANYDITFLRADKYLTINRRSISNGTVTFNEEYIYNGTEIKPVPTLVVNNTVLVVDRDYTITYTNNINQGTARLTLTGIGNYKDTKTATYTINKVNFERHKNKLSVEVIPDTYIYDATAHEPATRVIFDGRELVRNTDYTVSYLNNIEVGNNSAIAVITGIGNYEGTAQATFTILPRQLEGTYTLSEYRYEYDGTPKEPRITSFVAPNGWNIVEGVDYTTQYVNNVNVGSAKIILTAMNHYTGTMEIGFEIYKTTPILTLRNKTVAYSGGNQYIDPATISKIYKYDGDYSENGARNKLVYNYYRDAELTNKLPNGTYPKNVGTYYVQAFLPQDANHNDAYSNIVKLVIFGNPTDPIIKGNDGRIIIENGGRVKDNIYINIYGSRAEGSDEVLIAYKYSINGGEWLNYTGTIERSTEGIVRLSAYAYIVDNPSMRSNIVTYQVTIDKTAPNAADVNTLDEADSVVIDVYVKDDNDEIEKIFITEDSSYTPTDDDDWIDVSGVQGEPDTTVFELSQGDEDKTIYVWQKDEAGNMVGPATKTITLNAIKIGNNNDNKTNIYFRVTDKYIHTSNITKNDIVLHVNGFNTTGKITNLTREEISFPRPGYKYTGVMEDVTGNGDLSWFINNKLVYDRAGNHPADNNQEIETKEITVDNVLPILRVTVLDNKVQIYAEDSHIKAVMLNGAILGRRNGDYEAYLSEGKNIIKVIDEYGNDVSQTVQYHKEIVETRSQANAPELIGDMKAIKYEGNNKIEVGYFTSEMYSYTSRGDGGENTTSRWANATTPDGSEWVWIPRFAYKAESDGTYSIIFLRERNNDYLDINGNISSLPLGYSVAKAFTQANYELRGFWISKYEISKETSSNNGSTWVEATNGGNVLTRNAGNASYVRAVSKANRTPWRSINVSTAFDNSESMYSACNSHLIKNSEYEATLLLGLSEYGRNGNYITLDTTDKTGTANNTSTTGNNTGVFDLLGGSWEYTSTFINNSALSTNASSLVNSSNHSIKEEITSSDLSDIILSSTEQSKLNTNAFNTSYIVYRGLDRQNSTISTPVGGAANNRIGYRVVLSNDNSPVSEGGSGSTSLTVTLNPNGAAGNSYTRTLSNTTSFTLPGSSYYVREGYQLKGWSESATTDADLDTYYTPGQTITVTRNTILYAVWKELRTSYISGTEFNAAVKNLAGATNANRDTENTNITAILWQTSEPSQSIKNSATNVGLSSETPIYAWFDNGTIKIWSEAKKITLNDNCEAMFKNLKGITTMDLSVALNVTNTDNVRTFGQAFDGCTNLTSIDESDISTKNLQNMFCMFRSCTNLRSLNLSGFDTTNVTNMRSAFEKCENLESINLTNLKTMNVTDMGYMFQGCKKITSLNLSSFNTSKVTDMMCMFDTCSNLTSVNITNFNTPLVTNMSFMFKGCEKVTTLNLSGFNTQRVTDMRYMFCLCKNLQTLTADFNTSQVTDMSYMFDSCEKLSAINLQNFDTAQVKNMQNMFKGCKAVSNLDTSRFVTNQVTNMAYMFCQCVNLTNVNVSNFDTSQVTDMTCMFDNCLKLASLDITNFDTSNVNSMKFMFVNDKELTALDLSNFNTSRVTNMDSMFSGCTKLVAIFVSNAFDTGNVTNSQNMFLNCSSIRGGSGTTYNSSKVDKEYARIDDLEPDRLPGYFRSK